MDDEAFARMLQQQLLDEERMLMEQEQQMPIGQAPPVESSPAQQDVPNYGHSHSYGHEQQESLNPPQNYQHDEDPDLAYARRVQEMESRGEFHNEHPSYEDQSPNGQPWLDQEEEDARLARMLEETGQSFRDLDHGSAPTSRAMSSHAQTESTPTAPTQMPSLKPPSQYSETPIPNRMPSGVIQGTPQRSPHGSEPVGMSQPIRSVAPHQDDQRNPLQEFSPMLGLPGNPQYTPKPRPQYPLRNEAPNRQPIPLVRRGPASGHPSRGTIPPHRPSSRGPPPENSPQINMDPVLLNQGPLQPAGSRQQQTWARAPNLSAGSGTPPGVNLRDIGEPPMMSGDAFLDVPAPAKKEKQKKLGLLGRFKKSSKSTPTSDVDSSMKSSSSSKSTPSRGLFGGKNRGRGQLGKTTSSESLEYAPSAEAKQDESKVEEEDGHVVKFKIPKPVPRPVDTIGAPKGPLPYSLSISRDAPKLPEAMVGRRPQLSLTRSSATCSVCMRPAQNPLSALNKKFHNECFRCITCHQLIDPMGAFAFVDNTGDKQPMHRKCFAEIFGIKCCVCKNSIPAGPDGKVSFVKHPFFDAEQMCPKHARNMTRRCTGCHRFEPENEPFADLNDVGRCVCMSCCRSVVVDSHDAQPLWAKVVDFFDNQLNMPIWKDFRKIPILVVGYNALNDQMNSTSCVHGGASQIMTRGLCLTEHESGRRFRMNRMKFDKSQSSFVASDAEDRGFTFFQVPDASKSNPDASVTAILCLSGLPKELSASVLAHEATHAWIKLHPRFDYERPIPPQVEEGCAQLVALLFLNEGLGPPMPLENNDGTGPSDEKLRQYFKFSIETDDHEIYGTGYRRAAMAYSKIGIEALMSHVVLYQEFPEI